MLEAFLNGLLLGFGVSVPVGPITILILSYALKSFKNALALGVGAMSADIFYLTLLQFGLLKILNHTLVLNFLSIFGFAFLSYIAFLMLKNRHQDLNLKEYHAQNLLKSYAKGLMLNLLNPFIIGFWLSVATLGASSTYPTLMILGLIGAIFTWVFALAFFVKKFSHFFSAKVIYFINVISAVIIEYFAIMLLYKNFFKG